MQVRHVLIIPLIISYYLRSLIKFNYGTVIGLRRQTISKKQKSRVSSKINFFAFLLLPQKASFLHANILKLEFDTI